MSQEHSHEEGWNELIPGTNDEEAYIKPIRLVKRQDQRKSSQHSRKSSISSLTDRRLSQSSTESAVTTAQLSATTSNSKSSNDEFQCRPMRLGSAQRITLPTHSKFETSSNSLPIKRKSIKIKNLPIKTTEPTNIDTMVDDDICSDSIFAICLVDFHHQRGPEVQWWKSNYHQDYSPELFANLSFQALPDGSHLFEETFSNFNLVYDFNSKKSIDDLSGLNKYAGDPRNLKTLFGCSCIRQIKTKDLSPQELDNNKDITRSIIQKAIVVISRKQPIFTKIKEKLLIVTKTYFQQTDFSNYDLLINLFDNLNTTFKLSDFNEEVSKRDSYLEDEEQKNLQEEEYFINLDLKQSILKFKANFLIIFKSLLLDKKILIYSNNNLEVLTLFQNNLISLIPNLISNLDYSGCPLIDYIETNGPLSKPTSLVTTNRKSMLRFFGLPLQIFNTKNSFWNPYLPLQQLDELSVKSYMIGCSNLLFVNQAKAYKIDLIVNLDTNEISYPNEFPEELALSSCDKKFINDLINKIDFNEDKFEGNDDYIRYQFEDYIVSLISTMRYHQYVERFNLPPPGFDNTSNVGDLSLFNKKFIECWTNSNNYKIWNVMADEFIFNFANPQHLGDSIVETNQAYKNISNFFNNFKSKGEAKPIPESSSNHQAKAQKFIEDDPVSIEKQAPTDSELEELSQDKESDNSVSTLISSWKSWGKKKT